MALGACVDHLVDCLHKTESGVKATSTDGASGVNHGKKCEGDGCRFQNSVLAFLCAVVDLANDALTEEKCAPELKQEYLSEPVEVDATSSLVVRTQEGRLA